MRWGVAHTASEAAALEGRGEKTAMIWIALLISLTFSMGFVCGCVWASRDRLGDDFADSQPAMARAATLSSYGGGSGGAVLDAVDSR